VPAMGDAAAPQQRNATEEEEKVAPVISRCSLFRAHRDRDEIASHSRGVPRMTDVPRKMRERCV